MPGVALSAREQERGAPAGGGRSGRVSDGLLLLPALVGAVLVILLSTPSMVVTPDSTVYIGTAESVKRGQGLTMPFVDSHGGFHLVNDPAEFTQPLLQFPPALPVVLGVGAEVGSPMGMSRVLNALSLAVVIGVAGWLVRAAGGSRGTAVTAQCFLIASFWFLELFTAVLTEAPFLATAAVLVALLVRMAGRPPTWPETGAVAGLLATATLFRYAGVGLVLGVGVLGLLRARREGLGHVRTSVAAGLSIVPLGLWLGTRGSGVGNRVIAFHPSLHGIVTSGLETVGRWVLPEVLPARVLQLGGALVVVGVVVLVATHLRRARPAERLVIEVLAVVTGGHLAMVLVSQLFLDVAVTLDRRHLSLLFLMAVPMVAVVGRALWDRLGRPVAGPVVVVALFGLQLANVAFHATDDGELDYQRDDLLGTIDRQVAALEPDVPIYSDRADLVWWATGRPAGALPVEYLATSGIANGEVDDELAALVGSRRYVVYVGDVPRAHLSARPNYVDERHLVDVTGARQVSRTGDVTVYELGG
jgi:hypothetical protein